MTDQTMDPNAGIRWDYTSVEATARADRRHPDDGYVGRFITTTSHFDVVPGVLPDLKPYASHTAHFRPDRVEAVWTTDDTGKTTFKRVELRGPRVLKSGDLSDRARMSYEAFTGELRQARLVQQGGATYLSDGPHVPTALLDAIDAHLAAHPLPVVEVRTQRR